MSKYGDDIRRIVGYTIVEAGFDETEEKPPIAGKRGTAFLQFGDTVTTAVGIPGGDDLPERAEEITANAVTSAATDAFKFALQQQENLEQGGDESLNNSPEKGGVGGGSTSPEDGIFDAESIIDGAVEAARNGLVPLNGISGVTDPATGEELTLRLDGLYTAPDATSIQNGQPFATADWQNSYTPPDALDIVSGGWFAITHSAGTMGTFRSNRYGKCISWDIDNTGVFQLFWEFTTNTGPSGSGPPSASDLASLPSGSNSNITYNFSILRTDDAPGVPTGSGTVSMFRCDMSSPPVDLAPYCSISDEDDFFPPTHPQELAMDIEGVIKSSQFNNTILGQTYRQGTNTVRLKFANDTRTLMVEPGRDNSSLIYEIDNDGEVISDVRQYSRGKVEQAVRGSNAYGLIINEPRRLINVVPSSDVDNLRFAPNSIIRLKDFTIK